MRKVLVAVVSACLLAFCQFTQAAHAQDVIVCPPGSGATSCGSYPTIQEAIDAAVPNSVISIPIGVRTEAGIHIENKDVTIRGADPQKTVVQAASAPCAVPDRVFRISGSRVKIEDLTIQNGCILFPTLPAAGGGIWNAGSLTLNRVVVRDNMVAYNEQVPIAGTATSAWVPRGGGIYSVGSLEIDSSTILSNSVLSSAGKAMGGGAYNNGRGHIASSTIAGNEAAARSIVGDELFGGGVYNAGSLTLEYSTVVSNSAETAGGGLYSAGDEELFNNLLYANSSPGGEAECTAPAAGPDCGMAVLGAVQLGSLITETNVPVFIPEMASSSIDAGICALSKIKIDQLGRPRSQGRECDLGAIERGIAYVPLVMSAPPMPDLIVKSVTIEPPGALDSSTKATVKVVIQNIGNKAAMGGFYVDLFINPRDTPPNHGGVTWLDLCRTDGCRNDEGIIWLAPPTVYPNESFTFTSDIDIDPRAVRASSSWDKYFPAGTVKLWVIVDSFEQNRLPDGYILERHEDNNRYDVPAFTVAQGSIPVAASSAAYPVTTPAALSTQQ